MNPLETSLTPENPSMKLMTPYLATPQMFADPDVQFSEQLKHKEGRNGIIGQPFSDSTVNANFIESACRGGCHFCKLQKVTTVRTPSNGNVKTVDPVSTISSLLLLKLINKIQQAQLINAYTILSQIQSHIADPPNGKNLQNGKQ